MMTQISNYDTCKGRNSYIDYLRVAATVAVMVIHTSGHVLTHCSTSASAKVFLNVLGGVAGGFVPLFAMISGVLFIPREIELRTLYNKYILRILISFLFWSVFYSVFFPLAGLVINGSSGTSFQAILRDIFSLDNHYHLWYLPMTIGLYLCLPIIKKITESNKLTRYFLVLFILFSSIIPTVFSILISIPQLSQNELIAELYSTVGYTEVSIVTGYSGYFVLGYYLNTTEFSRKTRTAICLTAITALTISFILNLAAGIKSNAGYFNISTLCFSSALFILFRFNLVAGKAPRFWANLSKLSFGAYLVHIFVLSVLEKIGIDNILIPSIPLLGLELLSVVAISFSVSFIINKIPVLNKWIV